MDPGHGAAGVEGRRVWGLFKDLTRFLKMTWNSSKNDSKNSTLQVTTAHDSQIELWDH